ncbi:MAG: VanZ family protein [Clostridia bacterium]|nr:VanZ family protein [Clostridia bacterium]
MICKTILSGFYTVFGAGIITAALSMFLFLECRKRPLRDIIRDMLGRIRRDREYRFIFIFAVYIGFVLFKTVLLRNIKSDVFGEIMEGWYIRNTEEGFNAHAVDNIILFVPMMLMLDIHSFGDGKRTVGTRAVVMNIIMPFSLSLCIEAVQLVFRIGSFQLIDLACNTLGGVIGGIAGLLYCEIKKRRGALRQTKLKC